MISTLLFAYLCYPRAFWAGQSAMQLERLESVLTVHSGLSPTSLARQLREGVEKRERYHSPVLHIANMGSSGSHWLEWLIAGVTDVSVAREVYLPVTLQMLSPVSSLRKKLVEAVVLLHADRSMEDSLHRPLIHSGHSFSLSPEPNVDKRFQRLFLFRDPLDIVLSRTFRKTKYREWIAPAASDRDYLFRNIKIVRRFYRLALQRNASATMHYEDLVADPEKALRDLFQTIGWPVDAERMRQSIRRKPPRQSGGGSSRDTEDAIPAELRAEAAEALSGLRKRLGYI